mgnify:CR=1 FL=1
MELLHVDNYTPFVWFAFEKMAPGRNLCDVLIVKALCELTATGSGNDIRPSTDGKVAPIHMSDALYETPNGAFASLERAGDTVLFKPATDFIVHGTALPPNTHTKEWPAQISVKTEHGIRRQIWILNGTRYWQYSILKGWHLGPAQNSDTLSLQYENAYGGSYPDKDGWQRYSANPAGVGYIPSARLDRHIYYPAARIELLGHRLDSRIDRHVDPPALGAIGRCWAARSHHAGTYDTSWFRQPEHLLGRDYPKDFDLHFFQVAHPFWIFTPYWIGNESIELLGLKGQEHIYGSLPGWQVLCSVQPLYANPITRPMVLDTVEIDLDAMQLYLTWRITLNQRWRVRQAQIKLRTYKT